MVAPFVGLCGHNMLRRGCDVAEPCRWYSSKNIKWIINEMLKRRLYVAQMYIFGHNSNKYNTHTHTHTVTTTKKQSTISIEINLKYDLHDVCVWEFVCGWNKQNHTDKQQNEQSNIVHTIHTWIMNGMNHLFLHHSLSLSLCPHSISHCAHLSRPNWSDIAIDRVCMGQEGFWCQPRNFSHVCQLFVVSCVWLPIHTLPMSA